MDAAAQVLPENFLSFLVHIKETDMSKQDSVSDALLTTPTGWAAEVAIPLATLQFSSRAGLPRLVIDVAGPTSNQLRFSHLAATWKRETEHFSVIHKRYRHAAYKAILDMKETAIPLILTELRRSPDRWLEALETLTGKNPAKSAQTFYEAVDDWIAWGIANDHIS